MTPEYNGGIPGILKYFMDMLPFPESFERRPVCFVGRPPESGALRPVEQLQAIFGYRNAFIFPERVFMPGIVKLLDASGKFTSDEMEKRPAKQAESFVAFVEGCARRSCGRDLRVPALAGPEDGDGVCA